MSLKKQIVPIKQKLVDDFLNKVIAMDTESTGIDPRTAEICELGTTAIQPGYDKLYTESKLFGTIKPIPFAASSKNNIGRSMLVDELKFEEELEYVLEALGLDEADLGNKLYLVAHNFKYDKTILEESFKRIEGAEYFLEELSKKKWICTYRLAQQLYKPSDELFKDDNFSYSLNYLRFAFGLDEKMEPSSSVHRAGDDSKNCWLLLEHIANQVLENFSDDELEGFDLGEFLYDLSNSPIEYTEMSFGKHKGQKLSEVPTSYYNWLLSNSTQLDEKSDDYNSDFAISIENELNRRLA